MQGYEPGISLCMIVKDEETFLRGSLDSVKSVVDEMIIIDTGSGDSSVQIAHDAGATVIETEWSDDFSMARNLSLGKANYEWILVLDADERISFSDYPRLRRLMELSDFFGFRLDQRSYVHHSNLTNAVPCVGEYAEEMKYPGYIPQDVVRFFRNYSAIEYRGRVHEIVEHSMIENHLSIEKSGIPIHHYGKVVEPERLIKKMNHYIKLGQLKMRENPDDPKSAIELLNQLTEIGNFEDALNMGKDFLLKFPMNVDVLFITAVAAEQAGKEREAGEYYKEVLKVDTIHLGALNNYSTILQRSGKLKKAVKMKKQAEQFYPANSVLKYNLANLQLEAGEEEKAEKNYLAACGLEPQNLLYHYAVAEYFFTRKRYDPARDFFKKVVSLDPNYRDAAVCLRDCQVQLTTIPLNQETYSYYNFSDKSFREGTTAPESNKTIALCLITRDSADTLADAIGSAKELVDEIVVLDTGSSDDTLTLAKSLGAVVYTKEWTNDFSAARNRALEFVTSDWILVLDSDEVMSDTDFNKITDAVNSDAFDGYKILQRNYTNNRNLKDWRKCSGEYGEIEGEWEGYLPSYIVRLFRNDPAIRFRGKVHELVEESIIDSGGRIGSLDVSIHHLGYSREEGDGNRSDYLELNIEKTIEQPDDLNAHYELGLQYFHGGNYADAKKSFEKAVELQENTTETNPNFTPDSSYNMLGVTLERLGEGNEAREVYETALKSYPGSTQLLTNLGIWFEERNKFQKSMDSYKRALDLEPENSAVREHLTRLEKKKGKREVSLSLCMIVKNEAETLPICLKSVEGIMDQIVIVDTGSEDGTIEAARSFGAEVYHFDWIDDFSAARNESLKHATGDYIIWLDADDVISPEQAKRLLELKLHMSKKRKRAYYLKIYNEMGGTADFTASQLRIFPNLPELRFRRRVHEQIIFSIDEQKIKTETVDITINHLGYGKGEQEKKYNRNRPLLLKELEENPDDFEMLYFLCRNHYLDGRYEIALNYGEKALSAVEREKKGVWYYHIKNKVAQVYLKSGDEAKALKLFRELVEEKNDDPLNHFAYGQALSVSGQYEEAEPYLLYFLKHINNIRIDSFPVSVPELELASHNHLGLIYSSLHQNEKAVEYYKKAIGIEQSSERAHKNLGAVYLKMGKFEDARKELMWCYERNPEDAAALTNLGTAENFSGNVSEAERYYREALKIDSDNIDAMINLGNLMFRLGEFTAAEPYLAEAVAADSSVVDARLLLAFIHAKINDTAYCMSAVKEVESLINVTASDENLELEERYLRLGIALDERIQRGEAILAFDVASALDREFHHSRKYAGILLVSAGRYSEALSRFEEAVNVDSHDWESFAAMGEAYEAMGKSEAAELSYQTAESIKRETIEMAL